MTAETPATAGQADCGCPETDGKIYHQRGTCTDPVVAKLGWYADAQPEPVTGTPGQADPWRVIADVMSELLRGGQTADIRCRAAVSVVARAGIDFDWRTSTIAAAPQSAPETSANPWRLLASLAAVLFEGDEPARERAGRAVEILERNGITFHDAFAAAREPQSASDLGVAYADLESEIRLAVGQHCTGPKVPCMFCLNEVDRTMKAIEIYARDVAQHERSRPQPAPELGAADKLIRDILESLCRRDGLSLESTVVPGEPARNYALAERLGIGHVFGLAPAPEFRTATIGLADDCLTPGAIYTTHICTGGMEVDVDFGRPLPLSEDGAARLDTDIHGALERILAPHFGSQAAPEAAPELAAAMPDSEATELRAVIDMIWRMCQDPKQAAGTSRGLVVNGEHLADRIAGLIKNSGMEPF